MSDESTGRALRGQSGFDVLCRVGSCICAIPVEHVAETMRPLPIERLAGMPSFILGVAVVRGAPLPVVDAAGILDVGPTQLGRFVSLRVGTRGVILAVDAVLGVRALPSAAFDELPPLLSQAGVDVVERIGMLDSRLLLLLNSGRVVPPSVWNAFGAAEAP